MQNQPSTPTQTTSTSSAFSRMVARLIDRLAKDNTPEHPGVIMDYGARGIDDGEYGDPHIDTRPDFVKEDEKGWTSLKP